MLCGPYDATLKSEGPFGWAFKDNSFHKYCHTGDSFIGKVNNDIREEFQRVCEHDKCLNNRGVKDNSFFRFMGTMSAEQLLALIMRKRGLGLATGDVRNGTNIEKRDSPSDLGSAFQGSIMAKRCLTQLSIMGLQFENHSEVGIVAYQIKLLPMMLASQMGARLNPSCPTSWWDC